MDIKDESVWIDLKVPGDIADIIYNYKPYSDLKKKINAHIIIVAGYKLLSNFTFLDITNDKNELIRDIYKHNLDDDIVITSPTQTQSNNSFIIEFSFKKGNLLKVFKVFIDLNQN